MDVPADEQVQGRPVDTSAAGREGSTVDPTAPRGAVLSGVSLSVVAASVLVILSSVPLDRALLPWLLLGAALGLTLVYVKIDHPTWRSTLVLALIGLCGAQFEHELPSGPGFVLMFLALIALGYHLPLRWALPAALPSIVLAAHASATHSLHPAGAMTSLVVAAVMLVIVAARAAAQRRSREQLERLRAQHDRAAAEAERARLARELHDILTHSLAGVQLRLEGTRLLIAQGRARGEGDAGGLAVEVADQVDLAHQLAVEGLGAARDAIRSLRGDDVGWLQKLPALLTEVEGSGLLAGASLDVQGTPRPVPAEVGHAIYRAVQESLTNVAHHTRPGTTARVRLVYRAQDVTVEVTDTGGAPTPSGACRASGARPVSGPSARPERVGYGLRGLAERAELLHGSLEAGSCAEGYRVQLSLPTGRAPD